MNSPQTCFVYVQLIWRDIGETEAEKDRMMMEIEKECKQIYKTKIDQANDARSHLRHTIAAKEADLSILKASLGDHTTTLPYVCTLETSLLILFLLI